MKKIVCFGEVLWDILPTEKIAGGAPMNVSIRLQSLGIEAKMISCVGNDVNGKELLTIIKEKKVDTSLIQTDSNRNTGEVLVSLNSAGNASYEIVYPSAWDGIQITDQNTAAVKEADAVVFGSLACRDNISKTTLLSLLDFAKYKIFDVNIRSPFYSISLINELMHLADFIKLNDDELIEIINALNGPTNTLEDAVLFLAKLTDTNTICVTKGKDGALLYIDNSFYSHPGYKVDVVDTIGAGDSFLAALLTKVLYSTDYEKAIDFACKIGSLVASQKGANPIINYDID